MAKNNRIFDLMETKGNFEIKGIVSGTKKDDFYKEKKTKTGKLMRNIKFGLVYAPGLELTVALNGMVRDKVYFSKRAEKKGEKPQLADVPWGDRFSFSREGFRMMGCNIGVTKKIDEKGSTVNDSMVLTEFDACQKIAENLKDGDSVYVRGKIEYSTLIDDNGNKKVITKLVPNQVSLCAPIDYANYEQKNNFVQTIIFTEIDKETDDNGKETGRFRVLAKIVSYSSIEDVEFFIENAELAKVFRQKLKPYNSIQVHGHIITSVQTETVEDDNWGEANKMQKVKSSARREFIITGATPSTLDTGIYSEENVEDALAKIAKANKVDNDFGGTSTTDEWGSTSSLSDDDDELEW